MQVTGCAEIRTGSRQHRIATGTKTCGFLPWFFNNTTIINSDQILRMPEIPKSYDCRGGESSGWNMLHVRHAGVRVTLIENVRDC